MIKFTLIKPSRTIWQEKPLESDIKKIEDIGSRGFPTERELAELKDRLSKAEEGEKKEELEELKEVEKLFEERQKLIGEAVAKIEKVTDNNTLCEILFKDHLEMRDIPKELAMAVLLNPNLSDSSLDEALRIASLSDMLFSKAPSVLLKELLRRNVVNSSNFYSVIDNPHADSDILCRIAEIINLGTGQGPHDSGAMERQEKTLNELLDHPNTDEKVCKILLEKGKELPGSIKIKILKKYPNLKQDEEDTN